MRVIVFDCDGTLVDSRHGIVACMQSAFQGCGLPSPGADAVARVVGLSLVPAIAALDPAGDRDRWHALADGYRQAALALRSRPDHDEPLFPGVRAVIETLHRRGHTMGIATGKNMRGLVHFLDHHDLGAYFVTLQTADGHPGKPHPSMLEQALAETAARPDEAMFVGDTTFDIEMGVAAGVLPVGVAWGNHPPDELERAGAAHMLTRIEDLLALLDAA